MKEKKISNHFFFSWKFLSSLCHWWCRQGWPSS